MKNVIADGEMAARGVAGIVPCSQRGAPRARGCLVCQCSGERKLAEMMSAYADRYGKEK